MLTAKVIIQNDKGIHCRPASEIVCEAIKFQAAIFLIKRGEDEKINAKVLIEILTLALHKGEEVIITTNGSDEKKALIEVSKVVGKNFLFDSF